MSSQKHIIVAGGSLAGLMTAVPLRRMGHRVTILERSPVPLLHDQGAGVVAGNETLEWVQTHGHKTKDQISVRSGWRLYLDKQGSCIDKEASSQFMTSWNLLYHLGRDQFDDKINSTDGEASYEYGRTATSIRDMGSQIEVEYQQNRQGNQQTTSGTIRGDFLIVADGPSSHLRNLILEDQEARTYAGYVAFRGTVPEVELSQKAQDVFVEKFTFFHGTDPNTQILAYTIPNSEGGLEKGGRLVNWVWYVNVEAESQEYIKLMTDKEGNRHRFTLPTGGMMQTRVWENQKQVAQDQLPPQFSELVQLTKEPFVQAITDLRPPKSKEDVGPLFDGKVVLVGDALAGFRPHTAASTSQAAFHALKLEQVFREALNWNDYQNVVFEFANRLQSHGVKLGERSQFGKHPLAG